MEFEKICINVTTVCTNCKGSYKATSGKYPTREKAEEDPRKKKGGKGAEKLNKIATKQDKVGKGAIIKEIKGKILMWNKEKNL